MKDTFRQSMKWFHTWVGLVVGWLLFFMFITGTTGYFYEEITRYMEPERPLIVHNLSKDELLVRAEKYLNIHASDSNEWDIYLPNRRDYNLQVGWREPPKAGETRGDWVNKVLDAETGQEVIVRDTSGGRLLYRMHYRLHYLDTGISYWIVGFCTMLMLLAVITGVVIHKKIFSDFFTFRAKKGLPGWLDSHNVLSVIALPFHFMITYSGLLFFLFTYMVLSTDIQSNEQELDELIADIYPRSAEVVPAKVPAKMQSLAVMYERTKAIWPDDSLERVEIYAANDINAKVSFVRSETDITYNPADAISFNGITGELLSEPERQYTVSGMIQNGFFSLHEGQFASTIARWVYILTGLIGTAMIASGLVLWTTKRKPQQMKKSQGPDFGYRLVEQLNIGTIVGLPIAMALYFYANRLLPLELADRAEWEAHVMFISWALLLIYPVFRPKAKAWLEQLNLATMVFIFLPVVNFLTTDKHLGVTLAHGDWQYAGFDLTMLAIGLTFAFAGFKFKQSQLKKNSQRKRTKVGQTKIKIPADNELVLNKKNSGAV
ncbi:MAG: PepSY domain-containing protein [Colwellia sp.]|nr:PepSY domain-containing protein [Colwellia sp.]